MQCTSTSGRVSIIEQPPPAVFTHSDQIPTKEFTTYHNALCGNWSSTPLSRNFFSKENITLLQNELKQGIYNLSNQQYIIENQDVEQLKIIMRSIFLQHAKNLPHDIKSQIKTLNAYVLDYSIKQVYQAILANLKYKEDASTIASPMELPIMPRTTHKQLMLKPWF